MSNPVNLPARSKFIGAKLSMYTATKGPFLRMYIECQLPSVTMVVGRMMPDDDGPRLMLKDLMNQGISLYDKNGFQEISN